MKRTVRSIETGPKDAGQTVQRLLHDRLGVSNAEAKGLIAAGCVVRNRRRVSKPDERVVAGDSVEVASEEGRKYATAARAPRGGEGWSILHEDDDLVVVDKDAGVLTVPTTAPAEDSLEEMLLASYRKRGHKKPSLHVVHRIDRFTSGLVVFARNHSAATALKRQFKERTPERIYLAVAEGSVEPDHGRLTHTLAENPLSLKVQVVLPGSDGLAASLRYRVLERFPHATLLEVTLETGRRNQIRVQLSAQRHPIVGDVAYGHPSALIPRAALHAHRLEFDAPRGSKRLRFESPAPPDFARLLKKLRGGAALERVKVVTARGGSDEARGPTGTVEAREPKRRDRRVARPRRSM